MSSKKKKICFALLIHNKKDLVRELLQNIALFCPNSSIVLFNGGDDPNLCEGLGYPVCPTSRRLHYGFLSVYHLEVMKWLEDIQYEYDYLINLDSDCLFGRVGFEDFILESMEDTDYMGVRLEIARDNWVVAETFRKEQERWKSVFEIEPLYGTFNVGQVFSRRYIQSLLKIPQLSLLEQNIERTETFALEEIIFVNMAKHLGLKFKPFPDEVTDIVRWRPYFSLNEIVHHLNERTYGYLFHPVDREKCDKGRMFLNDLMLQEMQKKYSDPKNILGYIRNINQVTGIPSFLNDLGLTSGPNELLAPLKSGKVANWRRLDDHLPWFGPYVFGDEKKAEAMGMIRSSLGKVEAIIRHGHRLAHYWREDDGEVSWHMSTYFGSNATGTPLLFENNAGNFEVVAPLESGGLVHWWRDNGRIDKPWLGPTLIDSENVVIPVSILEENNELVVVASVGESLVFYVRDETGKWSNSLASYDEVKTVSWSGYSEKL